SAAAYAGRGQLAQYALGQPEQAIADFKKAVELRPANAEDRRVLAWLLATCQDSKVRDGAAAVEVAQKACEMTGWKDGRYLDTSAAACATAGQFEAAINHASRAVDLTPPSEREAIQDRLKLYKSGREYRE